MSSSARCTRVARQDGGNIRVGFLFRTDRGLAFVDRPGGTATTPVTVQPGPVLSVSPGRILPDPSDPNHAQAFDRARKPLVGEFTSHGHRLFIVGNHVTSRLGSSSLFGRPQPADEMATATAWRKPKSWPALSMTCSRPIRMPWSWF